jgi:3-phenylpropionate/trans-cinnamate dioxygenase ferredoxin reductase subunit
LRALDVQVTVLEATARVLERVTAPEVSTFFERIHREQGVDIRTNAMVEGLSGDRMVREVTLASGESIPADLVIVGIGVEPNTDLAADAGLVIDNGIVIDDRARTNDPDIMAAGDCASHDMARYDRRIRLESVSSAGEQAKVAASTVCGKSRKIEALPWFWSDQYHFKLQIAGLNTGYDEVVLSGDPARDSDFSCFYLHAGELIAADCIGRPRDFIYSKRAIAQRLPVQRAELMLGGLARN